MPAGTARVLLLFYLLLGVVCGTQPSSTASLHGVEVQQAAGRQLLASSTPAQQQLPAASPDWVDQLVTSTATIQVSREPLKPTSGSGSSNSLRAKVTLDGRQSSAPRGRKIKRYSWRITRAAGTKAPTKLDYVGEQIVVSLPPGSYKVKLIVLDSAGSSASAEEAVLINGPPPSKQAAAPPQPSTKSPAAAAGSNKAAQPSAAAPGASQQQQQQQQQQLMLLQQQQEQQRQQQKLLQERQQVQHELHSWQLQQRLQQQQEVAQYTPPPPQPQPRPRPQPAPAAVAPIPPPPSLDPPAAAGPLQPTPAAPPPTPQAPAPTVPSVPPTPAAAAAPVPPPQPKPRPPPSLDYDDYGPDKTPLPPAPVRAGPEKNSIGD